MLDSSLTCGGKTVRSSRCGRPQRSSSLWVYLPVCRLSHKRRTVQQKLRNTHWDSSDRCCSRRAQQLSEACRTFVIILAAPMGIPGCAHRTPRHARALRPSLFFVAPVWVAAPLADPHLASAVGSRTSALNSRFKRRPGWTAGSIALIPYGSRQSPPRRRRPYEIQSRCASACSPSWPTDFCEQPTAVRPSSR
jgi:hypothetical protein